MAVAFSAQTNNGVEENVSSVTFAHTVSADTDMVLAVFAAGYDSVSGDRDVTGVTYNGDAMTLGVEGDGSAGDSANFHCSGWYLAAPDTGSAFNVVVTYGGTCLIASCSAISLSGVDQSNPLDCSNTGFTSDNASHSVNVTTVAANVLVVDGGIVIIPISTNTNTAGAGQTDRVNVKNASASAGVIASTEPKVSAGAVTMSWSQSGSSTNLVDWGTALMGFMPTAAPSAALTGTAEPSITEADVVAGGKTIILTLTNDTWVASGATFDAQRQNIIDGLDSAQSELTGWNNEVRDNLAVTTVARTSDTVVTITLSAQAAYDITATETITATIPATAVTGGNAIVATPTFTVTHVSDGGEGEFAFLQATTDTTDTNTYTFASQNLGTADADRYIIVSAVARKAGAAFTLSSITVAGQSATIVKQITNTVTNSDTAALAIAAVPTGTSGSIVVTWSTTVLRCAIGVWRAVNIDSPTPYDDGSSTAADPTTTLDIPNGGFAVGAGLTAAASSATWTGLTENFDSTLESFVTYTGASTEFASSETGRTITIDFGSSTESAGVFASWAYDAGAPATSVKDFISMGFIAFPR